MKTLTIITGASKGLGFELTRQSLKAGDTVVTMERRPSKALVEEADKIGCNFIQFTADLLDRKGAVELLMWLLSDKEYAEHDRLILINNAGVLDTGLAPVGKFDDVETQKVISINQVGTMQCIRAALQYMTEGASIVNVASVAGVNGGGGAAYVSTKSAIIGITKHTALLLADKYIRCNAVCPGTIVTPMTMNMKPEALDMRMMGAMSKHADLKIRPCMADDVANIIGFLASDDSKALTGQVVVSDFGASL